MSKIKVIEEAFWKQCDAVCYLLYRVSLYNNGGGDSQESNPESSLGMPNDVFVSMDSTNTGCDFWLKIALSFRIGCRDSNVGKMVAFSAEILIKKFCIDIYFKI